MRGEMVKNEGGGTIRNQNSKGINVSSVIREFFKEFKQVMM